MNYVDATPYYFSLRRSVLSLLLATSVLGISACSSGGDSGGAAPSADPNDNDIVVVDPNEAVPEASEDSIADGLLRRTDYQTLLRFIQENDLTEALQGDNNGVGWTLFAPDDSALESAGQDSLSAEQSGALVGLHLHSGQLNVADLIPGELQMTQGSVEVVQNPDGSVTVGGATIVAGDRVMSNGVIHFVGSVLEPL